MDDLGRVWDILNELRSIDSQLDLLKIVRALPKSGVTLNHPMLREIIVRLKLGYFYLPDYLLNFLLSLIDRMSPGSILDPSCGLGSIAVPVAERFPGAKVYACCNDRAITEVCSLIEHKGTISWFSQLLDFRKESGLPTSFDLCVSAPPFGVKCPGDRIQIDDKELTLLDDFASIQLARCASLLKDDGRAVFILADSFFTPSRAESIFSNLASLGLWIEACFGVPSGAFAPFSQVRSNIVVFRRVPAENVFLAGVTNDADSNSVVINNWKAKKPSKTVTLGFFERSECFRGYSAFEAKEKSQQREREFARRGFRRSTVRELATSINLCSRDNSFPELKNAVYIPLIGTGPVVTSVGEFTIKPQNYIQMAFEKGDVIAGYLAGFLNSPAGKDIRRDSVSGNYIPKLTKASVAEMPLFLPDRSLQSNALALSNRISQLKNELSELEHEPWLSATSLPLVVQKLNRLNQPEQLEEQFEAWIDTLPFPLASILWTYYASRDNPHKAYQQLLHFFEGFAEFLAVIHLSAAWSNKEFYDGERSEFERVIEKLHISFERATFGTWKAVVEFFSMRFRDLLKDGTGEEVCQELFKTSDRDLVETLAGSAIVDILQETNKLRNLWTGHGGIVSDEDAKERHVILEGLLQKLRAKLGLKWCRYELVYPTSCVIKEDGFDYDCQRLMGSRTPFARVQRTTTSKLVCNKNYLQF